MKFNWNNWNIGGKIIFIAACVASVSMLMNWVDIGFRAESGLSQGTFLFLGLWVYLALILLTNKAMDRGWDSCAQSHQSGARCGTSHQNQLSLWVVP